MNKAVILIAVSCVVAFAVMVSAQYPMGGYGAAYGYGRSSGYQQYLAQLERYNQVQQLKTLTTATRGLRNSALVSLG